MQKLENPVGERERERGRDLGSVYESVWRRVCVCVCEREIERERFAKRGKYNEVNKE